MAERACLTLASVFCWAVRAPSRVIAAVEGRGREAMGRGSGVVGGGVYPTCGSVQLEWKGVY